jgi:hypothetical protein
MSASANKISLIQHFQGHRMELESNEPISLTQ